MTLDKFGRHIVKQARLSTNNDDDKHVINVSEYMYYNLILKFESDKLIRKTFVLNSGMNHYSFPLEWGLIEKVLIHLYAQDDISVTMHRNSNDVGNGFQTKRSARISRAEWDYNLDS